MEPATASRSIGAADKVAAELWTRLFSGEFLPGTPLREVALAEEFGVSRNTLRDALQLLISDDLVEAQRYKGVVVKAMTADDIRDIFLVRRTIELRAVEDSWSAAPSALQLLSQRVADAERIAMDENWDALPTAGLRAHQAIVGLLGSPRFDSMFDTVVAQIRLAFAVIPDQAKFQLSFTARKREVCDLLLAGSRASACAALRSYLDDSERELLDAVQQSPRPTLHIA